ncbi:UNVERIFIED_CONTAM: hypothetical protein GTU68_054211, partial [Idotea baltica]|nr:hypothetical protein [Idotea baltica]
FLKAEAASLLVRVRAVRPHVHCITNSVAQTFTANVLLALGVEPSMTIAPDEIGAFVSASDATLINLGTLDADRRQAALIAAETANGLGKPFVLDPVFAHKSPSRKQLCETILALEPTAMRGNAEEISGIEANASKTVLAETGVTDIVRFGGKTVQLQNGDPLMAKTTAVGCALGGVIAAFLTVGNDRFVAVTAALISFGVAGQIAADKAKGPGSFVPEFLDALHQLTPDDIEKLGRIS